MDVMSIIGYLVGILFNIGIVASIRASAVEKGREFLSSGRFALLAVFVLCFLELLVVGRFEALQDSSSFIKLIGDAWAMAGIAVAGHGCAKTLAGKK